MQGMETRYWVMFAVLAVILYYSYSTYQCVKDN